MAGKNRIASTETAFGILDVVHECDGASAEEITERTDLSRAGVYKHLRTLVAVDALANRDGVYHLGPKFTDYGLDSGNSKSVLERTDRIDELHRSLDAPTTLWIQENRICRCAYTAGGGSDATLPRQRGDTEPLPASPPGKAILAHLPSSRRDDPGFETSDPSLADDLEQLRDRKVLREPLAAAPEWVSVSTPVLNPSDYPVAAIEALVVSERATAIEVRNNVEGLLTETANALRVGML